MSPGPVIKITRNKKSSSSQSALSKAAGGVEKLFNILDIPQTVIENIGAAGGSLVEGRASPGEALGILTDFSNIGDSYVERRKKLEKAGFLKPISIPDSGVAGFLTDLGINIVTDPLTYLSLGGSVAIEQGGKAVKIGASQLAGKLLSRSEGEAARELASKLIKGGTSKLVKQDVEKMSEILGQKVILNPAKFAGVASDVDSVASKIGRTVKPSNVIAVRRTAQINKSGIDRVADELALRLSAVPEGTTANISDIFEPVLKNQSSQRQMAIIDAVSERFSGKAGLLQPGKLDEGLKQIREAQLAIYAKSSFRNIKEHYKHGIENFMAKLTKDEGGFVSLLDNLKSKYPDALSGAQESSLRLFDTLSDSERAYLAFKLEGNADPLEAVNRVFSGSLTREAAEKVITFTFKPKNPLLSEQVFQGTLDDLAKALYATPNRSDIYGAFRGVSRQQMAKVLRDIHNVPTVAEALSSIMARNIAGLKIADLNLGLDIARPGARTATRDAKLESLFNQLDPNVRGVTPKALSKREAALADLEKIIDVPGTSKVVSKAEAKETITQNARQSMAFLEDIRSTVAAIDESSLPPELVGAYNRIKDYVAVQLELVDGVVREISPQQFLVEAPDWIKGANELKSYVLKDPDAFDLIARTYFSSSLGRLGFVDAPETFAKIINSFSVDTFAPNFLKRIGNTLSRGFLANPGTGITNAMTGLIMNKLNTSMTSREITSYTEKALRQAIRYARTGRMDREWQLLLDSGLSNNNLFHDVLVESKGPDLLSKLPDNLESTIRNRPRPVRRTVDTMLKIHQVAEIANRLSVGKWAVDKGMPVNEALDLINNIHFDYQDLPKLVRAAQDKGATIFTTFRTKMMLLGLDMVIENPRLLTVAVNASRSSSRDDKLPDYLKNQFVINLGLGSITDGRIPSRLGFAYLEPVTSILTILDPEGDGVNISSIPGNTLSEIAQSTNPAVSSVLASALNRDPFTGGDIEQYAGQPSQAFTNLLNNPVVKPLMKIIGPVLAGTGFVVKTRKGEYLTTKKNAYVLTNSVPALAMARRLFPTEPSKEENRVLSWINTLTGSFSYNVTDSQLKYMEYEERKKAAAARRKAQDLGYLPKPKSKNSSKVKSKKLKIKVRKMRASKPTNKRIKIAKRTRH